MEREPHTPADRGRSHLHPTLLRLSKALAELGLQVYIIGARSLAIHGIDLGRETSDWDVTIDKPFTPELRDTITEKLRSLGFKVQWRKWGFLVKNDANIDINYAPLTLDAEFAGRSTIVAEGIYLPSLEDIVVLKLMSSERKDYEDVKKILHQAWYKLDREYLYKRARQAGLERELRRVLRRLGLG